MCREVLHEVGGDSSELLTCEPGADPPNVDICIWDYAAGRQLPVWVQNGNPRQHLFLVGRQDLEDFRAAAQTGTANVLLKPIGRPTLRAFLEQTVTSEKDNAGSLRAVRDDMLQCVIQANLRLQEYNLERTNFLARVVHDFRAPLTSICGYCSLLTDGKIGELSNNQKDAIERMASSARRLTGLAETLLQLSVGRRHENRPKFAEADLPDCVEQVIRELMASMDQKDISVSSDFSPTARPLHFDMSKLQQVLANLLDNSCRFTPPSGFIDVKGRPYFWERRLIPERRVRALERRKTVSQSANCYRVDIHDSGPGIPRRLLGKVFEEYTSYFGGADRSGGGLGLAICRVLVEAHEGRIWAENDGNGTTMAFVLPYAHANGCQCCSPDGKERVH